jgi:hypothetical protein
VERFFRANAGFGNPEPANKNAESIAPRRVAFGLFLGVMDDQVTLLVVLLAVFFIAGVVAIVAAFKLFRKKIGFSIERGSTFPVFSRTFNFSIGGPPPDSLPTPQELSAMQKLEPLDSHVRERYVRYWERAKDRFDRYPVDAVRDAEQLLTDLMKERGSSAVSMDEKREYAMDVAQTLCGMDDVFGKIENARAAARGMSAAREGRDADVEDLRQAMLVYESAFQKLLEG